MEFCFSVYKSGIKLQIWLYILVFIHLMYHRHLSMCMCYINLSLFFRWMFSHQVLCGCTIIYLTIPSHCVFFLNASLNILEYLSFHIHMRISIEQIPSVKFLDRSTFYNFISPYLVTEKCLICSGSRNLLLNQKLMRVL